MSARGRGALTRGGAAKKTNLLPNLSVAGKRETKAAASTSKENNREKRGRGRGGRGRGGRGRTEDRESRKTNYIEQTGIFSSGLNDDGRHDRPRVRDEFSFPSTSRTKKPEKIDVEMVEGIDVKPVTYETEWISDEEGDLEELTELLRDEFISDLKRGDVKPLVLPLSDEPQFDALVKKVDVKKEEVVDQEMPDKSSSSSTSPPVSKKRSVRQTEKELSKMEVLEEKAGTVDPTFSSSQRAAVFFQNHQQAEGGLLLWQLPSTISTLASSSKIDEANGELAEKQEKKAEGGHCLNELPSGTELGQLRIRKSGRADLALGRKLSLDVTCAVPAHHRESVVMIKLDQQHKDGFGDMQGIKSEFPIGKKSGNEIFVLGSLSKTFVCSHDFPQSIGVRRKAAEKQKEEVTLDKDDEEVKALLTELQRIEKKEETWKDWARDYAHSLSDDAAE